MPGSGAAHYGVMARAQDHRGAMFGSSINLNGKSTFGIKQDYMSNRCDNILQWLQMEK